jgi:hypothetical protein
MSESAFVARTRDRVQEFVRFGLSCEPVVSAHDSQASPYQCRNQHKSFSVPRAAPPIRAMRQHCRAIVAKVQCHYLGARWRSGRKLFEDTLPLRGGASRPPALFVLWRDDLIDFVVAPLAVRVWAFARPTTRER